MMLERLLSPQDLKRLPLEDLPSLAEEIRALIVETVGSNGGHMASNLGVVELTIALHRLFDSPLDVILFDTSHQSYAHKILTGRARGFRSLRTAGGYSGFLEPRESPHDVLVVGHAGCGPSLALGLALAEKMRGGSGHVVCVIGDGALTSGIAYEGLSNIIAEKPSNLMLVLNDNGMSISPNTGWLAEWRGRWLPRLRSQLELDRDFQALERATESLAPKVPLGPLALSLGKGVKSAIQRALLPGIGHFWDEMGFNYIGPVDGHNIGELLEVLQSARLYSTAVPFVHVLTNKGQGWGPAEEDPVRFHQPSTPTGGAPTYSAVWASTLGQLMEQDSSIVAISAAMLEGTGLQALRERFPDRVWDVGICEQHAVSMAAGMARRGLRPVVCIYSTFLQRAFDQILHDVCLNDLPVVFGVDRAGIVGQDGKTHQGLYDLAYMRIPPNMVVAVPRDENELRHLLYTALRQSHPFSIRYPRGEGRGLPLEELRSIPVGTAEVLREGADIRLVAVGELVHVAVEAAAILEKEGIEAQVLNARFLKPVDPSLIQELLYDGGACPILVLEEASSVGGLFAALLEAMEGAPIVAPLHHLSVGDIFLEHAPAQELRHKLGLDPEGVVEKVKSIVGGGG